MGSVYEEITRLETAKADIETAIEGCGVNVPDTDLISTYALYIRQIPSAVFSELNVDPVGGEDKYIKSIKQTNGLIEATTGGLVSSTSSGIVPKITVSSTAINSQANDWILTSTSGKTPAWKKLPTSAFYKYVGTTELQTTSKPQDLTGIKNIIGENSKEIIHATDGYLEFGKGFSDVITWFNASLYKFKLGNTQAFIITTDGKVCIGDVGGAPKAKLHVAGGSVLADSYHAWYGGFSKEGCSDAQILLAGGGHKAVSDFASASGVVTALSTSGNLITWTKNGIVNTLTVPYATIAGSANSIAWGNITGKPSSFTPSSHTHTYIESKANYTFTASTLPNSFDWGVSAGFVADSAGYGSYGSVLTVRTYTAGGGTLLLYAPYSNTYGGSRLKARFGNYDSNNGDSWTALKEIAWTSDIPTKTSQLTNDSGFVTGGPYLPLTGGTLSNNARNLLILHDTNSSTSSRGAWIKFSSAGSNNYTTIGLNTTTGTFLEHYVGTTPYVLKIDNNGVLYFRDNTVLHSGNIGSQSVNYASSATYATNSTYLYASDSPYRYGDSAPYYMRMRYNVNGDYRWYLSVYPETPKDVAVDYANSAGTASYATSAGSVAWSGITGKPVLPVYYNLSGSDAYSILKNNATSFARNQLVHAYLGYGSASFAMGWVLSGYDSNPYCAFIVNSYGDNWSLVGSSSGSWTHRTLLHSGNIGSQSVNYATSAGSSDYLKIHDIRNNNYAPNSTSWPLNNIRAWFNNTGTPNGDWWSGITVKGWTNDYNVWLLASTSTSHSYASYGLFFRTGNGSNWTNWKNVVTSESVNNIVVTSSLPATKVNNTIYILV